MTSVPQLKTVAPEVRAQSLESQIGHTPLLAFRSITAHLPADVAIYAKAEWANPGGSVKDRAAYSIVRKAEREGTEAHFQRLRQGGIETAETSSLHLDLLRDLKQINSHFVAAAAYPVLEERGELLQSRTPSPVPQAAVTAND